MLCDDNYPPYVMRNSQGDLEGIVVDLWKEWERNTAIPVTLRAYSWSEALTRFETGEGDVVDTIFDIPERRKFLSFSPPYAQIEVPIFTHSSISGITDASDLRGLKVAVKSGDAAVIELIRHGVTELSLYESYEAIIDAAGRLDVRVFCMDSPPAYYFLYKKGMDRDFRIPFILNVGAFSRAVRIGDESLLAQIQAGFDSLPRKTVSDIERRWLGSELPRIPNWRLIGILAVAAGLTLAFLSGITLILRRKIRNATRELTEKIALLEESERRTIKALGEREVLLQEIHHRVKNNLQIISSLVRLQAEGSSNAFVHELIQNIQSRISAMANLHDRLYNSPDLARIDGAEYVQALVDDLAVTFSFYGFVCKAGPVPLSIESALPLGLIINEGAVNAIKYAYPPSTSGSIEIRLGAKDGECVCVISDSGRGLPPDLNPETNGSLGFTIMRTLASQLRGRLLYGGPPGFSIELRFPLSADFGIAGKSGPKPPSSA